MKKETRNTLLIVGGVALLVVLVVKSRQTATVQPTGGTTGLFGQVAGAITSVSTTVRGLFGSGSGSNPPSDGEYVPDIAQGEDHWAQ